MQRRRFHLGDDPSAYPDAVLCRDLTLTSVKPTVTIRRGTALVEAIERLPEGTTGITFDILVPDPGDLEQPDASMMLAEGIIGPGIDLEGPHQGQMNLHAQDFGLLRVDVEALHRLNRSGAALVATGLDGRVVSAGETVAIVKAPELYLAGDAVRRALSYTRGEAVLRVAPFKVERVGFLAGTRIHPANLKVASRQISATLARFGARIVGTRHLDTDTPEAIAAAYQELLDAGAEVMLVAGSIVLDPADPFLTALRRIGARVVKRGAPIDPGTMFWVAYAGDVPFFGLASCELYGRTSVLDLFLPYALAKEEISRRLISESGYGGLLVETQQARRPADWDRMPAEAAASAGE